RFQNMADVLFHKCPPYFEIGNERRSMCWLNDRAVGDSHA
ncbi:ABC transporter ATP-binding protein, partial [Bacillus sp. SS-TM]